MIIFEGHMSLVHPRESPAVWIIIVLLKISTPQTTTQYDPNLTRSESQGKLVILEISATPKAQNGVVFV